MKKKVCKHCKIEMDKNVKICPNCNKRQGLNKVLLIIILLFAIGLIIAFIQSILTPNDNTSDENKIKAANIGEIITINNVDYVVNEKIIQKEVLAVGGLMKYTADGNYLLIKLTITNNSNGPININANDFTLKDENGARYSASILISVKDMDMFNFETINPNATETGYIAYDIANTNLHYTLTINDSSLSHFSNREIQIQ